VPLATAATGVGKRVVTYAACSCLRTLQQHALASDHMERATLIYHFHWVGEIDGVQVPVVDRRRLPGCLVWPAAVRAAVLRP
jgi:hypothetical protein